VPAGLSVDHCVVMANIIIVIARTVAEKQRFSQYRRVYLAYLLSPFLALVLLFTGVKSK